MWFYKNSMVNSSIQYKKMVEIMIFIISLSRNSLHEGKWHDLWNILNFYECLKLNQQFKYLTNIMKIKLY